MPSLRDCKHLRNNASPRKSRIPKTSQRQIVFPSIQNTRFRNSPSPPSLQGSKMSRTISPYPPPHMQYSKLAEQPKVAILIANVINTFSNLERQLPDLLRHITGLANNDAETIAGLFIGFSSRIELLEKLLESRNTQQAEGEFEIAKQFCSALRKANTVRNTYAHSMFLVSNDEVLMATYISDSKRSTKKQFVTENSINNDLSFLESVVFYLSGYLRRNERPPREFLKSL